MSDEPKTEPPDLRRHLPERRGGEAYEIVYKEQCFTVTVGCYGAAGDGAIGEVFLNPHKASSSELESVARDAAILISIALQYGAPIDVIRHAVTRGNFGEPASIVGAIVDSLGEPAGAP